MIKIAFIAQKNKTNQLIIEFLFTSFSCSIEFYDSSAIHNNFKELLLYEYDLAIIDLNTVSGNSIKATQMAKSFFKNTPLLTLHIYDDENLVASILNAGANGFLPISPTERQLKETVSLLVGGKV